jgi:hypothetical protein
MKERQLLTQYIKETRWVPTRREDALRIIAEEVGDADPEGTLAYVLAATKDGKTVTVGSCRFRQEKAPDVKGAAPSRSS